MTNLRQGLLGGLFLSLAFLPAHAVTTQTTFDLTSSSFDYDVDPFSITQDGITLSIAASTFHDDGSIDTSAETVGQYGQYGLGVTSGYDGRRWQPTSSHAIDNDGYNDRLEFNFSENVRLVSAEFYVYGSDNTFRIFQDGNNDDVLNALDLLSGPFEFTNTPGGNSYLHQAGYAFNASFVGSLFAIGAGESILTEVESWGCIRWRRGRCKRYGKKIESIYSYSAFKIASLTVETVSTIPVPAALPLFGTGLAMMGFLGYRRRRQNKTISA